MVKIAFSGKLCSGKSTAAAIVSEIINDVKILSFAGKLKELAIDLFGMVKKDRSLLIDLGEKMRDIDPDVWVKCLIRESEKHEIVVVDDLRFSNEYNTLHEKGFILIRINITREQQIQRLKKLYDNWEEHASKWNDPTEIALDNHNFDHYINASESLDDLRQQLLVVLNDY